MPESIDHPGRQHDRGDKCVYCGNETPLRISGVPICLACDKLSPEERGKKRQEGEATYKYPTHPQAHYPRNPVDR